MTPKTTLLTVLILVLTGEAISDFIARHHTAFTAVGIVAFSLVLIRGIMLSQKDRREGGPFL